MMIRLSGDDCDRLRHYAARFEVSAATLAAAIVKQRLERADQRGVMVFRTRLQAQA